MTNYENLVAECNSYGIKVIELSLDNSKACGKCIGKTIIINKNISEKEKYCVLCEELGHYHLTIGNITNQTKLSNKKQEVLARRWAYRKNVGLIDLIDAFKAGCKTKYEIAEFLNVTPKYLEEAISYYKSKYGVDYVIDCYHIIFSPSFFIGKMIV
ncbi:ImmA/IrrE family metallo-endopeptidase [uncultured Clostridium sp.]|uniref:ImmA/IrrE family metallo-endopeptidase n=1 Tax=uncultured Clostridium sp. TaxID=59620 RepID=UPI00258BEC80|nr:ImmA/IrrE family metallo-endopeptidase [uncultured Clostridium sp.]